MKYLLHRGGGPCPAIEITFDEFNQIKSAQRSLSIMLGIENKFEMLVDN